MTSLRTYLHPDPYVGPPGPTVFKTERNQYEVRCGTCGTISYVDEQTFKFVAEAIHVGLDNFFRCDRCKNGVQRRGL